MKLQIALEYMVIFAFIMLIFMVVFVTVAKQRASLSNQQLDSHLQLVVDDIASQMNIAQQAGNGYNSTLAIPSSGSLLTYNLNVTGNGEVIAASKVGNELISAVAFSLSSSVVSNPSWLAVNNDSYSIPIGNGTISLSNNYGTLCLDYFCPNITGTAGTVSLSSLNIHTPQFNGESSYITTSANSFPTGNAQRSTFAWVYFTGNTSNEYDIYSYGAAVSNERFQLMIVGNDLSVGIDGSTQNSVFRIPRNQWSFVGVTYTTSNAYLYYNNQSQQVTLTGVNTVLSGSPLSAIGGISGSGIPNFQGSIDNVQVYNTSLQANQVIALYKEGLDGLPVVSSNDVAWWLLNGNANDYSGNRNNGNVIGYLPYISVSELFAKVTNRGGSVPQNSLVQFQTSIGNFSTGPGYSSTTNVTGIATAFLTQQQTSGYAVVKATAFGGGNATQNSLAAWWPMNLGQGLLSPGIFGSNNIGTMTNASWSAPSLTTGFDGVDSYVVGNANTLLSRPLTVTAWVYDTEPATVVSQNIRNEIFNGGSILLNLQGNKLCFYEAGVNTAFLCSTTAISRSKWYFLSATYNMSTNTETVYINGAVADTLSISGTPSTESTNAISIGECEYCGSETYFFKGYISDVQEYTNALSPGAISDLYQKGISSVPLAGQSNIGWWPLNGNANDYSNHNQNGSSVNTYPAQLNYSSFSNSSVGATYAAKFTGSASNTIQLGTGTALQPLGSVSVTAWVNASTSQSGKPQLVSNNGSTGQQGYNLSINGGKVDFTVRQLSSTFGACSVTGTTSILDARNHFVAGVYNGTAITVYLDGLLQASSACSSGPINYSSISNGLIGNRFDGTISNVQLYSGSLSPTNLSSMYLQGPNAFPLPGRGLIGWYPLDGSLNDYSLYGNNGTSSSILYSTKNAILQSTVQSISGYGTIFSGENSYISTGASALPLGSSQRSVFAWIYFTGTQNGNYTIYSYGGGTAGAGTCTSHESAGFFISGGTLQLLECGTTAASTLHIVPRTWNFVGYTYNGASNVIFWLNTQQQSEAGSALNTVLPNDDPADIGKMSNLPSSSIDYFSGSIANVQVFNAALNSSQEFQLYKSQLPPSATADIPITWLP